MELQRRYGAGRLAEIFGTEALATDRQMRVLGLYRAAEAEIPFLSTPVRRGLEAYAAGVNAFLASRHGALPPEFLLLRFTPEPWQPADSLVWGKLMAVRLGGNYRGELLRARMARTVPAADLALLYPEYPKEAPTTLSDILPIYRRLALDSLYDALPPVVGPIYASNNWVVDGRHSASGKPLLANDPHLEFGAPGFWYLARLKTPQHEIAGGTAAGSPFVLIGHNERIAWGLTTTTADVEDLFIERVDPADPGRYLTPQGTAPFVSRQETILVRGAAPVDIAIRTTRHGPVLSDVLPAGAADPGYVLALAATFTIPEDRTAEALWELNRAADWPSFRAALRNFVGPMQNIVYGDVDGTIGFIAPGLVPIRTQRRRLAAGAGMDRRIRLGRVHPIRGAAAARPTRRRVTLSAPTTRSCRTATPISSAATGICRTAPNGSKRCSPRPRSKHRRRAPLSQADTLSLMAQRLVPLMTRINGADETSQRGDPPPAAAGTSVWTADKVEPLLFTAWLREFSREMLLDRLGDAADGLLGLEAAGHGGGADRAPGLVRRPKAAASTRAALRGLADALGAALAQLRQAYGADMTQWRWGRAHVAHVRQPGLQPDSDAARLARHSDPDLRAGTTRSTAARARSVTMLIPSSSASAPGCASSPISRRRTMR